MMTILLPLLLLFPQIKEVTLLIDWFHNFKVFYYLFIEIRIFKEFKNKIFEIYLFIAYTLEYFHISHYNVHRIFEGKILRENETVGIDLRFLFFNLLHDMHFVLSN